MNKQFNLQESLSELVAGSSTRANGPIPPLRFKPSQVCRGTLRPFTESLGEMRTGESRERFAEIIQIASYGIVLYLQEQEDGHLYADMKASDPAIRGMTVRVLIEGKDSQTLTYDFFFPKDAEELAVFMDLGPLGEIRSRLGNELTWISVPMNAAMSRSEQSDAASGMLWSLRSMNMLVYRLASKFFPVEPQFVVATETSKLDHRAMALRQRLGIRRHPWAVFELLEWVGVGLFASFLRAPKPTSCESNHGITLCYSEMYSRRESAASTRSSCSV